MGRRLPPVVLAGLDDAGPFRHLRRGLDLRSAAQAGPVPAFAAMVILHSAANMLSDVFDFKRGLDRDVTPVSGAVVRGWLSTGTVTRAAILLFAIGSAIGIGLALVTGWTLFYVGLVGVAVGAGYTLLKYRALGDLAVFLDLGFLAGLGSFVVQTGTFSWLPVFVDDPDVDARHRHPPCQ